MCIIILLVIITVVVLNSGGLGGPAVPQTLQSLVVPDARGTGADVVLGFDDARGYLADRAYHGATVGRYAGRIAGARCVVAGAGEVRLAANNGAHHLHGGPGGFHSKVWAARRAGPGAVAFELLSPHLDEGYPGALAVRVTYTLTDANELVVDYEATTTAPTPVNLTNHSYFNLAGASAGADVLGHLLASPATHYLPVDAGLIPTGIQAPVTGTPFDFAEPTPLGAPRMLSLPNGYDHTLLVPHPEGRGLALAAHVVEPTSGRVLKVLTTETSFQLYLGGFLDNQAGKGGVPMPRFGGFCVETQAPPDSPNQPAFPSTILRPGEKYASRTVFAFSTQPPAPAIL
jgi:aldose 1-epimerase